MTKFCKSNCRERSRTRKSKKTKKKSMVMNIGVICLVAVFGVFYLFKTNFIAVEGYKVDDLQNKLSVLKYENEKLELQTVELRSVTDLKKRVESLNMVMVDNVSHVNQVNTAVAIR